MEIACPHCGLLRATHAEVSATPCPRCAERTRLLGNAASAEAGPRRGEWHVLLRGLQRGPYTLAALRRLLEHEPDDPEAQVWRAGMTAWLPARELPTDRDSSMDAGAAPGASAASSPTAVRQSRVLVVRDVPRSALGQLGAEPPRLAPPEPAPQLAPALAEPAVTEDFREASTTLRPGAAPARSRASLAAGEVTLEIPALRARSALSAHWLRWLALASVLSIGVMALFVALRRPPATAPRPPLAVAHAVPSAPSLPIANAAAPISVPAPTAALTQPASAPPPAPAPTAPPEVPTHRELTLRVGSPWAPIRDTTSATAQVVCSLPRGTQLTALVQRPGRRGRWFEVHCDKHQLGWVHENHLASVH